MDLADGVGVLSELRAPATGGIGLAELARLSREGRNERLAVHQKLAGTAGELVRERADSVTLATSRAGERAANFSMNEWLQY